MRILLTVCVGLLLWASIAEADDGESFVYLGSERPVFLRVNVKVDGKSHRDPWTAWLSEIFRSSDADRDGSLSGDEIAKLPQADLLRSAESNPVVPNAEWEPDADRNGKVTLDEFLKAVKRCVGPSLSIRMSGGVPQMNPYDGQMQNPDQGAQLVFRQLDLNRDKRLSLDELGLAHQSIRKLDRDDDDSLSAQELSGTNPYAGYAVAANPQTPKQANLPFIALSQGEVGSRDVRKFVQTYDRMSDGKPSDLKLTRDELRIPEGTFTAHDRDADGGLDYDEVLDLLRSAAPQVECSLYVNVNWERTPALEIVRHDPTLGAEVRKSPSGELTLVLGLAQIELSLPNQNAFDSVQFLDSQFKGADFDNNGYVDDKEAMRSYYVQQLFRAADADKDKKLFPREFTAYVSSRQKAGQSRTVLELSDAGRNLFEILDVNRDRRLSPGEIQSLAERSRPWDLDKDGQIADSEVPQHFRLSARRGAPLIVGLNFAVPNVMSMPGVQVQKGSGWFRHMDRNGDGEVSRREFVGQPALFDRLDADRNGLIDQAEAGAAK